MECASRAILDAEPGAYKQAEWEVAAPLLRSLTPDMLRTLGIKAE
jgi:hypothetical protein